VNASEDVEGVIRALVAAWNSGNSVGFGLLFTEEARYTGADGGLRQGRDQIASLLHNFGPGHEVALDGPTVIGKQELRATARFRWVSKYQGRSRAGIIRAVLLMTTDGWRIDVLDNQSAKVE